MQPLAIIHWTGHTFGFPLTTICYLQKDVHIISKWLQRDGVLNFVEWLSQEGVN